MSNHTINERSQQILKTLVDHYIEEGNPVGSQALIKASGISLSSATVRSVLADLEEKGYIYSPHTSAGRVPTTKGYRLFIDSLLSVQPLQDHYFQKLQQEFAHEKNSENFIDTVTQLLSGLTRHVGLVTVPRVKQQVFRHIEFLSLSDRRILVILVLNEQMVQNRIIQVEHDYSSIELEHAANFLNQHYSGYFLSNIRKDLLAGMQQDKQLFDSCMQSLLKVADQAFEQQKPNEEVLVAGQQNLLDLAEQNNDIERVRELFATLSQKQALIHLFDQLNQQEGVQIFIGEESGHKLFDDCSMVTSSYQVDGKVVGALGVLGPTRMNYQHVISIVDITAKMLGNTLSNKS